jgi:hypothetical protein
MFGVLHYFQQHKALATLLLGYWLVALGVYAVWEVRDWYPPVGDEPHHIIVGRAILHHASLEQTQAYQDEFARGYLGHSGDAITRSNAHVVEGPRGRFSIHSLGTGIIAILPMALSDLFGSGNDVLFIKIFFVLLSGCAVVAAWVLASLYLKSTSARVLAVLLTCFGLPLLIAANQVFPDLPAGVIAVCLLAWLALRCSQPMASLWQYWVAMCVVTCLPWLHYKFSVMAVVIGLAVIYAASRRGANWKQLLGMCVIPAIGGVLFFSYNWYAFGNPVDFHSSAGIQINSRALMWFFALNLDRWHGLLLQNPVFFVGLLFLVPFIVREPLVGLTALCAYLAATGINAAHGSPGYSFAGRHAWTGYLCLMPATIYGLGCLESLSRRIYFVTAAGLLALQAVAIVPLVITKHDLYNTSDRVWFDVYPSFFPETLHRFLPAFYNLDWWYRLPMNYVFIIFAAALVLIGGWSYPRRRKQTLHLLASLLLIAAPVIVVVGFAQPTPPREPLVFSASSMSRHFGIVRESAVLASVDMHEAGIWTFGPYIRLPVGDYKVIFHIQSNAPPNVKVGSWDVTGHVGRERLASADVMGTGGKRGEVVGQFRIVSSKQGEDIETRLFFEDVADVLFIDVVVNPMN